jgi:hypothetical protein
LASAVPAFARIALCARAQARFFMLALARRLKEKYNAEIHLYCNGAQQVEFYTPFIAEGLFATVTDSEIWMERCNDQNLDEAEVIARARELELRLNTTINRLLVPSRHFGRGYMLGGFYHPRSQQSERTSYVQVVHAYSAMLEFWEAELRGRRITLCINGTPTAAITARSMNIPYRVLVGSRMRNLHAWAWNEFYENPAFEKRWHELSDADGAEMTAPYDRHLTNRSNYRSRFSFKVALKAAVRTTLQYVYWHIRGYWKARSYLYLETIKFHFRIWRDYRRYTKLAVTKLNDLQGKRFVYFPLHVEPETALQGLSPEYFYQHALIAAVSRDLPAGVYLAVKEALGAVGRRPDCFYEQIADLKNVVWLDCWELGFECARKADAVVTICGTVGLEAVANGTPVIAFGQHNIYNFLPSVRVVTEESRLPHYLEEALCDPRVAERTGREGRRLVRAITDCSFDMAQYDYMNLNDFQMSSVDDAVRSLAESVLEEEPQLAVAAD